MKAIRAQRLSGLIIASIVMAAAGAGFLQTSAQATEIIRIPAGETLEIATDSVSPAAQFSWILTKDRRFQTAQRTRFFQTRIAEPGTYSLDVSIQDTKTGENAYRAFTIVVTEPTQADLPPEIQEPNQQTRSAILSAEPPLIQGVSYLPPSGGMLKLDASKSTGVIGSYSLDLDTAVDTSGDGNPANDKDNEGTLSEKTGSPVYLFALPAPHARIIRLSVSDISDPQTATSDISVGFSAEVPAIQSSQSSGVPQIQNPNSPIIMKPDGMTVSFEASVTEAQGKQVLTEWDFGDRSRSLLEKPSHTYAFPGTYTVSLTVRDITTAAVLYSGTTSVNILPVQTSSSSSSEASVASSSSSSSAGSSTGNGSAGAIVKVGMIVLFLLLLAGGLYALLFWLKRRTTLSIQKTLEKVEETIVKKDPKEEVIDASAPMKMKRETAAVIEADSVTDREKSKISARRIGRT
jgi:PKD repeat protein